MTYDEAQTLTPGTPVIVPCPVFGPPLIGVFNPKLREVPCAARVGHRYREAGGPDGVGLVKTDGPVLDKLGHFWADWDGGVGRLLVHYSEAEFC